MSTNTTTTDCRLTTTTTACLPSALVRFDIALLAAFVGRFSYDLDLRYRCQRFVISTRYRPGLCDLVSVNEAVCRLRERGQATYLRCEALRIIANLSDVELSVIRRHGLFG
jgi:hypothetical protein